MDEQRFDLRMDAAMDTEPSGEVGDTANEVGEQMDVAAFAEFEESGELPDAAGDRDVISDLMDEAAGDVPAAQDSADAGRAVYDMMAEAALEKGDTPDETPDTPAPEKKPDYSFQWTGYETHEYPEVENPKVFTTGYSTTPDDTYHPGPIHMDDTDV